MGLRITRRRMAISAFLGGAGAWLFLSEFRATRSVSDFDFVPLEDPTGFRRITTGNFSSGWDPLAGIESASSADESEAVGRVRKDLFAAHFSGVEQLAPGVCRLLSSPTIVARTVEFYRIS